MLFIVEKIFLNTVVIKTYSFAHFISENQSIINMLGLNLFLRSMIAAHDLPPFKLSNTETV
jgi:hypothetical protein